MANLATFLIRSGVVCLIGLGLMGCSATANLASEATQIGAAPSTVCAAIIQQEAQSLAAIKAQLNSGP